MALPIGTERDSSSNNEAKKASLLQSGTVIDGRYEVEAFVGKGGMCSVYRAKHLALGRSIAVKMLGGKLSLSSESMGRFKREAIAVGALDHPNIIKGYGLGFHDDAAYMAIEYIEGESLADRLAREGKLDKDSFIRIMSDVCSGLAYAHSQGIIHRDLKPSNIMLLPGDQARIVDFGLAKLLPETRREFQRLTQTGTVFGTVAYMSPEQCAGAKTDERTDIYSLGCMMYELLDGSVPFVGDSNFSVMYQHSIGELKPSDNLGDFAGIICACLEKEPERRPQSVAQIAEAIRVPGSYRQARQPQVKRGQTRRLDAVLIGAMTVVLAALAVYGMTLLLHKPAPEVVCVPLVIDRASRIVIERPHLDAESLGQCQREIDIALKMPGETSANQRQILRALLTRILALRGDSDFQNAVSDLRHHDDPFGEYSRDYSVALVLIGEHYMLRSDNDESLYWLIRQFHYVERTGKPDHLSDQMYSLPKMAEVYRRCGELSKLSVCCRLMLQYQPNDQKLKRELAAIEAALRAPTPPRT